MVNEWNLGTLSIQLTNLKYTPTVLVEVDGVEWLFTIDTGASVCLIQPRISHAKITATNIATKAI
jgi:hypothetical protein